jgi:alkylated DNA repair dioxygenase AlkB
VFGDVVGISLLAPARLRFRRRRGAKWERFSLIAEPRSAYALQSEARHIWEHSIPAMDGLRYSITFRSLSAPRFRGED